MVKGTTPGLNFIYVHLNPVIEPGADDRGKSAETSQLEEPVSHTCFGKDFSVICVLANGSHLPAMGGGTTFLDPRTPAFR